jgi:hypothetical protein
MSRSSPLYKNVKQYKPYKNFTLFFTPVREAIMIIALKYVKKNNNIYFNTNTYKAMAH